MSGEERLKDLSGKTFMINVSAGLSKAFRSALVGLEIKIIHVEKVRTPFSGESGAQGGFAGTAASVYGEKCGAVFGFGDVEKGLMYIRKKAVCSVHFRKFL